MAQGLRILIVEDSEALGGVLRLLLASRTPDIQVRQTGQEGIDEIQQGKADVVLLDVRLPDMSGLDVLAKLRSATGGQPVPVITMTAFDYDTDELLASGASAHIPKTSPDFGSPDGLWSIISQAVSQHQARSVLTDDEVLLVLQLAKGDPIKTVAKTLGCSRRTVYRKLDVVKDKLGVSSAREVVAQAIRLGIVN